MTHGCICIIGRVACYHYSGALCLPICPTDKHDWNLIPLEHIIWNGIILYMPQRLKSSDIYGDITLNIILKMPLTTCSRHFWCSMPRRFPDHKFPTKHRRTVSKNPFTFDGLLRRLSFRADPALLETQAVVSNTFQCETWLWSSKSKVQIAEEAENSPRSKNASFYKRRPRWAI